MTPFEISPGHNIEEAPMTIKNISALVIALALLVPSIAIAKVDRSESTTSFEIEEITETGDVEKVEKVKVTEEVEIEVIKPETRCRMTFDLKGWSVFYRRAKGTGVIRCDNGQNAHVRLSAHGGGVTFGKNEIKDGHGTFTKVEDISKLFGSYATSEAHAGASKSADAQAMTRGKVSLALSGTGEGYDLGFAFGSLKITPIENPMDEMNDQTAKVE
jgi:hypothetical protein